MLLPVAASFVAIGVALFRSGQQILGGITAAFFFACGAAIVRRLMTSSKSAIRFDASGLTIGRSGKPLCLAWSDIGSAYLASIRSRTFVCIAPRDFDRALASASPAARVLVQANVALVGAPYALPTAISLDAHDLLRIVSAYAPTIVDETSTA